MVSKAAFKSSFVIVDDSLSFTFSCATTLSTRFLSLPVSVFRDEPYEVAPLRLTKLFAEVDVVPPLVVKIHSVGNQAKDSGANNKRSGPAAHIEGIFEEDEGGTERRELEERERVVATFCHWLAYGLGNPMYCGVRTRPTASGSAAFFAALLYSRRGRIEQSLLDVVRDAARRLR